MSRARLYSEDRCCWVPVDGLRAREDGRLVLRLTRKRANHPDFNPTEDAVYDEIVPAFVAWLEQGDGELTQIVRLSAPKGAELRDVGKWAIEYAIVGAEAVVAEFDLTHE